MRHADCAPELIFPDIQATRGKLTSDEIALCKELAVDFSRISVNVATRRNPRFPQCSTAQAIKSALGKLDQDTRTKAVEFARRTYGNLRTGKGDSTELAPELLKRARKFFRQRLDSFRPELESALKNVAGQARKAEPLYPATVVDLRLAGETAQTWRDSMQIASPESITCRWRTEEVGARRGYWELRGPTLAGSPGKLLAYGFLEDVIEGDETGGYFDIPLGKYLPPQPPQMVQRYHIRVLPLPDVTQSIGYGHVGDFVATPLNEFEPAPPAGVGPWSRPAVILYGQSFMQGPQQFNIGTINYFRKLRLRINWFRVDSDQTGPGAEEYHIRAFVVQHNTLESRSHGQFGTDFVIPEGDRQKRNLGWKAIAALGEPHTNVWPRTFFVGLSIMEEDGGQELADWQAAVTEIFSDVLRGEFADEIREVLQSIREDIEDATTGMREALAGEVAAWVAVAIASVLVKFAWVTVLLYVAMIATFIGYGSRDDFFGFHLHSLILNTNDADRLMNAANEDPPPAKVLDSKAAAAGSVFEGSEEEGLFTLKETEIQFFGSGAPDSASNADGIVRMGLTWDFFDKVTRNV